MPRRKNTFISPYFPEEKCVISTRSNHFLLDKPQPKKTESISNFVSSRQNNFYTPKKFIRKTKSTNQDLWIEPKPWSEVFQQDRLRWMNCVRKQQITPKTI